MFALDVDGIRMLASKIATGEVVDEEEVRDAPRWVAVCIAFLRKTKRGDYQAVLNRMIRAEEWIQAGLDCGNVVARIRSLWSVVYVAWRQLAMFAEIFRRTPLHRRGTTSSLSSRPDLTNQITSSRSAIRQESPGFSLQSLLTLVYHDEKQASQTCANQ